MRKMGMEMCIHNFPHAYWDLYKNKLGLYPKSLPIPSFTIPYIHEFTVYAYLSCCLREWLRALNLGPNPEHPLQVRTGIVVSAKKGWRMDAVKLPKNRGKSAVCILEVGID